MVDKLAESSEIKGLWQLEIAENKVLKKNFMDSFKAN